MPYKAGYMEGKRKKAFYLDEGIAKALAYHSIDTGVSQSEIVERALARELGLPGDNIGHQTELSIVSRADAEEDWSIGYLDQRPAVGDWKSNWYVVSSDTTVLNAFEGVVWHLKGGRWVQTPKGDWHDDVTPRARLVAGESDYTETE